MSGRVDEVRAVLARLDLPDGGNLVSRDMVKALGVDGGTVRFVIEAPAPEAARGMEGLRQAAEAAVARLPWVEKVTAALTAHGPAAPPKLQIGGHGRPQPQGPQPIPGVKRIIAVGSGKGGVGKSTVSANLAVALARQGRRVGLLDADFYGPSQPRMLGVTEGPKSPDGQRIVPLRAHGVTMMSIGLMVKPDTALIWRGPMLMGAMQQMLGQVDWGELDVLLIDMPPGTGDVQLSLAQKVPVDGAIIVSTPQDVALIDARRAIDAFRTLNVPLLGLIENMSLYICPNCGHEAHLFGHGGAAEEAQRLGVPLLGALPIDLQTRIGGDEGRPVAAGSGAMAEAYGKIAAGLVASGVA